MMKENWSFSNGNPPNTRPNQRGKYFKKFANFLMNLAIVMRAFCGLFRFAFWPGNEKELEPAVP